MGARARVLVACIVGATATGMGHTPPRFVTDTDPQSRLGQLEALEAPELRALVRSRQDELNRIRAALEHSQDELQWYAEAERLGIVAALEDSGLPIRQRRRVAASIVREARLNDLDPRLVLAVIAVESRFDPYAISGVGARGLMQVMPATGAWLLEAKGERLPRPSQLFDAELNVELGTAYLSALVARFGRLEEALVAYNSGPTTARQLLSQPSSRKKLLDGYPRKVLSERNRLGGPPTGMQIAAGHLK
jgi:soluble lytic murein transglycosylase